MTVTNQAPIGSVWRFKAETKGRTWKVTGRRPGGVVEYMQVGRAVTGEIYLRDWLRNAEMISDSAPRLPATTCTETIGGDPETALRLSFQIKVF